MAYPQANIVGTLGGKLMVDQPPPPQESVQQVLDQTQEKLAAIECQVDEVIGRLFNFPRGTATNVKEALPPAVSERILELRSRAIRINEALATILEKL